MTYPFASDASSRFYSSTSLLASSSDTSNAPTLEFVSSLPSIEDDYNSTVIIGKKSSLDDLVMSKLMEPLGLKGASNDPIVETILKSIGKQKGGSSSSYLLSSDSKVHKLSLGGLPSKLSRNNHPMAVHSLTKLIGSLAGTSSKGSNTRVVVLTDDHPIGPLALAMAKAFPLFSKKSKSASSSSSSTSDDDDGGGEAEDASATTDDGEGDDDNAPKKRTISIVFCKSDGTMVDGAAELKAAQVAAAGVQLAARLVDTHPALLTTTRYAKEVQELVDDYNQNCGDEKPKVAMKQIIGPDLKPYGGLYGVGQAANCPPRMILLEYDGSNGDDSVETVALVGKVRSFFPV